MKRTGHERKAKTRRGPAAMAWLVAGILLVSTGLAVGGQALSITLNDQTLLDTDPINIDLLDVEGIEGTLDAYAIASIEWHDDMTGFNLTSTIPFHTVVVELCLDVQRIIVLDGFVNAYTFEGDEQIAGVKLITDLEVYLFHEEAQCPPANGEPAPPEEEEPAPSEEEEPGHTCPCPAPEEEEEPAPSEEEQPAPEEGEANVTLDITVVFHENKTGFDVHSNVAFDLLILVHCTLNVELKLDEPVKTLTHITDDPLVGILVDVGGMKHFAADLVCPLPIDPTPSEGCVGPQEITGKALSDPANFLEWSAFEGADSYNLYRAEAGGSFELHGSTEGNMTEFMDHDVVVGTTYSYTVTAVVDGHESDACDQVEITAIPVLPTILAGVAASIAGLGAYMMSRRVRA